MMRASKVLPCTCLLLTLVTVFHEQAQGVITPTDLPAPIYDCFEGMRNVSFYHSEPAEHFTITCMTKYMWQFSGVNCQRNASDVLKQQKYVQSLLGSVYQTRKKRQAGGLHVRKEYRAMSRRERAVFHRALLGLKRSGEYDILAGYHRGSVGSTAHGGPAFLGWHRIYLLLYEIALTREAGEPVAIPYWDSTMEFNMENRASASQLWGREFLGQLDPWPTVFGPLRRDPGQFGSLISGDEVRQLVASGSNDQLYEYLESVHNGPHVWVGGFMQQLALAAEDPIFFMHHCFIDYIWYKAQQRMSPDLRWEYPRTGQFGHRPDDPMGNLRLRGRVISNLEGYSERLATSFFTYEDSPTCASGCRPPYLVCNNGLGCAATSRRGQRRQRQQWSQQRQRQQWRWKRSTHPSPLPYHDDLRTPNISPKDQDYPPKQIYPPDRSRKQDYPPNKARDGRTDYPIKKNTPELKETCHGKSVQNTFELDCDCNINKWSFLPVRVVHLRTDRVVYNSRVIIDGRDVKGYDMYYGYKNNKVNNYIKPEQPTCYERCKIDKSGTSKIVIASYGLNYQGMYKEYLFLDNRQPVSSNMAYIGIRRPTKKASRVFITAYDQCGRICTPYCKVKGTSPPKYRPCSGALSITNKSPRYYGNEYGDAVLKYWNLEEGLPKPREENIFIVFYCQSKEKWWPWPGCRRSSHNYEK